MEKRERSLRNVIRQNLSEVPPPSDEEGKSVAVSAGGLLGVPPKRSLDIYEEEREKSNGQASAAALRDR